MTSRVQRKVSKRCGHAIGPGKLCRNIVEDHAARCWLHRGAKDKSGRLDFTVGARSAEEK